MRTFRRGLERVAAAVLVAAGITVVAAGLVGFGGPPANGTSSSSPATSRPSATASAGPTASPPASGAAGGSTSPTATGSPSAVPAGAAPPTRIVVPALRIDLGVYPSTYPGGQDYPLCDAAQYFVPGPDTAAARLGLPGQAGRSTYIYGHARTGMFLPLLQGSQVHDGAGMLGDLVQVYTADGRVYLYEVFRVKRHVRDFSLPASVPADAQWLVMQTSEGPNYTYPKLQVAARLLNVQPATPAAIRPSTTPAPSCPG